MKLRGIEFGNILGASGVQGFFGEGYWFHKVWGQLGLDFNGVTFVAKTATLQSREGNMVLSSDYTPRQLFPNCVKAKVGRGIMLNSVGLSNPGLRVLLKTNKWQKRTEPFWLSVMSLGDTPEKRVDEIREIVDIIGSHMHNFSAKFGVQPNLSCPNTGHDPSELVGESAEVLEILRPLNVPIMPKYSIASAPIEAILELGNHPICDAICVSNTIPFGWQGIDWKATWGSNTSPLEKLGRGGLSGKALLPLVCNWIDQLRDAGFTKPINGGGGIMSADDVREYHGAGASSVFIGSVAVLRPWRVKSIVNKANELNWEES